MDDEFAVRDTPVSLRIQPSASRLTCSPIGLFSGEHTANEGASVMTCGTAHPAHATGDQSSKSPALGPDLRLPRGRSTVAFLWRATVLAAAAGAAGCGWKTDYPGPPTSLDTAVVVEMQTQDGDPLGSKVFTPLASRGTLTLADVGNRAGLSSKYIVLRKAPSGGEVGPRLDYTNAGSIPVPNLTDGKPIKAIFMSTADLPESVMDCFAVVAFRSGPPSSVIRVGRARPGSLDRAGLTILDGDETILTNAIADINRALVDRQGVSLGRFSWEPDNPLADFHAGFGWYSPPDDSWDYYDGSDLILVSPMEPRHLQATSALGAFFNLFAASDATYSSGCGASGPLLADPANDYRLSKQGVSLVRFVANVAGVKSYW
jgi:hypothetical protein